MALYYHTAFGRAKETMFTVLKESLPSTEYRVLSFLSNYMNQEDYSINRGILPNVGIKCEKESGDWTFADDRVAEADPDERAAFYNLIRRRLIFKIESKYSTVDVYIINPYIFTDWGQLLRTTWEAFDKTRWAKLNMKLLDAKGEPIKKETA